MYKGGESTLKGEGYYRKRHLYTKLQKNEANMNEESSSILKENRIFWY